ncbi:MAG: glutamine synthetase [Armatimonadetes bacterium]|nr:glutamine synthetase [Armatimonadota bacterium]
MSDPQFPDWFTPECFDTVIVAFPDAYGRLLGKRLTYDHFTQSAVRSGVDSCNYLLTVDLEMEPMPGYALASWEQGYGDFNGRIDLRSLRPLPWHEGSALVLCDLTHEDGSPVEESPRQVLRRQIARLAEKGVVACMGSELEFYLFAETFSALTARRFADARQASDYLIDYHILQPGRDEDVLRRLRNEMCAAGITVECSKGEWGRGQHEVNLAYAEALEMADRHTVYKLGAKEIADQQGRSVTFMAKWAADEAGSSCHLHSSLWDAAVERNLFWEPDPPGPGPLFRQFLGGLLRYGRELTYFVAQTVNAYKRYQPASWAPTRMVWAPDNRTCAFRVVGHGQGFRIENRIPGADTNPYLAFAATIAAGLRGIEEDLDCGDPFRGDAYLGDELPRVPESLEHALDLFAGSSLAREAFGDAVVEFYLHTGRIEATAFRSAVTDWERIRYFEQL